MINNDTLYHYCSNDSFCSIINNQKIWLSSLSLSNDTLEGKLVAKILEHLSKEDGLDAQTTQRILEAAKLLEEVFDGFGFCLSEDGDLLSQWRGYANDATGVSVGFSKEYLGELSKASKDKKQSGLTLKKVEYKLTTQIKKVQPTFLKVKDFIDKGAFKSTGMIGLLDIRSEEEIKNDDAEIQKLYKKLSITIVLLISDLFLLKSEAFKEEQEWRLLSYFAKNINDNCLFRANENKIIPYREFRLEKLGCNSINEIILGPKNNTPIYVIESLMLNSGFSDVKITRSSASYR